MRTHHLRLPLFACLGLTFACGGPEPVDPPEIDQTASPLTCAFSREITFSGAWDFLPSNGGAQEAVVEVLGRLHTVAPVWNGATGDFDTLVLTTNCAGTVGAHRLGTPGAEEVADAFVVSHDGAHLILTGRVDDDLWIAKIRVSDRTPIWSTRVANAGLQLRGQAIIRLPSDSTGADDYLIAGSAANTSVSQLLATRVSDAGAIVWTRRYQVGTDRHEMPGLIMGPNLAYIATTSIDTTLDTRYYSIHRIRVATGLATTAYYYPVAGGGPALDLAGGPARIASVAKGGGYIGSYSLRAASPTPYGAAALLRLDDNLQPVWERTYETGGFTRALAPFETPTGFALSHTDAGISAILQTDGLGNFIQNNHYLTTGLTDPSVAPAAQLGSQWVLRTVDGPSMMLTSVDAPSGSFSCRAPVPTTTGAVPRTRTSHTPTQWVGGAVAAHPINRIAETPTLLTNICR